MRELSWSFLAVVDLIGEPEEDRNAISRHKCRPSQRLAAETQGKTLRERSTSIESWCSGHLKVPELSTHSAEVLASQGQDNKQRAAIESAETPGAIYTESQGALQLRACSAYR